MRTQLTVLTLAMAALVLLGCGDAETTEPEFLGEYSTTLAQPADVLNNLQVAYRKREIEPYADLLAPEFIFKFQEDDITPDIPLGFWIKDEDVLGTGILFAAVQVTDIRVALRTAPPETLVVPPPGDTAVRVMVRADLEVDLADGETTLQVTDNLQVFYLRRGRAHEGEDPDRWFLYQWDDLGDAGSSGIAPQVAKRNWGTIKRIFGNTAGEPQIINSTWGSIKISFGPGNSPQVEQSSWSTIKAIFR